MLTKFSNKNTRGLVVSKEEKEKKWFVVTIV